MMDSETSASNLRLKQGLLTKWDKYHQEFVLLSDVYEKKWKQMKEAKLRTGRYVFKILFSECPNMEFLMENDYGNARRRLNKLSEKQLIELTEMFDDYIDFFRRRLTSSISDYSDRLMIGKHNCYAMSAEKCYYLRQKKK